MNNIVIVINYTTSTVVYKIILRLQLDTRALLVFTQRHLEVPETNFGNH